jgi:hypothetical protein
VLTDGKNTENITTYGMGYDMKRYSRSGRSILPSQAPGAI